MRNAERIAADRQKITDSRVLELLFEHVRGHIALNDSQLSTGFGLLKKILPDFSTSTPPRDDETSEVESPSTHPEFEINIVDPQEA